MSLEDALLEGIHSLAFAGPNRNPLEYDGHRTEAMASKQTASIGTVLNGITPIYDVTGPDALEFLRSACVNSYKNFRVGQIRHAVLTNDKGQILTDGVVAHIAEGQYRTYWLAPALEYRLINSELDVHGEDLTGTEFFFQVAGPRSLEILEQASQSDLHDIGFAKHRIAAFDDYDVHVIRLGMAGGLAYELHGPMEGAEYVYRSIWAAGAEHGLKKLGWWGYTMQHTESGFANINTHYPLPWYEEPEMAAFFDTRPAAAFFNKFRDLTGSVGNELEVRFLSPVQVGWGNLVDLEHEFPGREVLRRELAADEHTAVTLVWNADDVADVYASQLRGADVEPIDTIHDRPTEVYTNMNTRQGFVYHSDWVVDAEGKRIGTTTGRTQSVHYRRMISLGYIDKAHSAIGTELTVVWGRPGTPQKNIRVTVERLPFLDLPNNNSIDVTVIPRLEIKPPSS